MARNIIRYDSGIRLDAKAAEGFGPQMQLKDFDRKGDGTRPATKAAEQIGTAMARIE
jgi:hypothetical protein